MLSFAEKSKAAGVKQFHMMSSQGANANSYFLYTQVKGEVDDKVSYTIIIILLIILLIILPIILLIILLILFYISCCFCVLYQK